MHSHLHTPKNKNCEEIMTMLDECHARGFLYKVVGGCNEVKQEVNRCLGKERHEHARKNREKAKENRARVEQVWREEGQS